MTLFMNRLPFLAFASILILSGCHRAPSAAAKNASDNSANPPVAKSDASPAMDYQATFHPRTKPLVSSDEIPLLEQIDRENEKVVAAATPSIVRIIAITPIDPHGQMFGDLPFKIPGMPHNPHSTAPSYGSGEIISRDG